MKRVTCDQRSRLYFFREDDVHRLLPMTVSDMDNKSPVLETSTCSFSRVHTRFLRLRHELSRRDLDETYTTHLIKRDIRYITT